MTFLAVSESYRFKHRIQCETCVYSQLDMSVGQNNNQHVRTNMLLDAVIITWPLPASLLLCFSACLSASLPLCLCSLCKVNRAMETADARMDLVRQSAQARLSCRLSSPFPSPSPSPPAGSRRRSRCRPRCRCRYRRRRHCPRLPI